MEEFIWRAQVSSNGQGEFNTFTTEFGDGYSQNIPNGIDPHKPSWSVVVKGSRALVKTVYDFIKARQGQSFIWRAPLEDLPGYFKCPRYSLNDEGASEWVLTLTFVKGNYIP